MSPYAVTEQEDDESEQQEREQDDFASPAAQPAQQ
jgi:hypothetical protein